MDKIELLPRLRSFAQLLTEKIREGKYRNVQNRHFGIGWKPFYNDYVYCDDFSEENKAMYKHYLEQIKALRSDRPTNQIYLQHNGDCCIMTMECIRGDDVICNDTTELSRKETEDLFYSLVLWETRLYDVSNEDIYESKRDENNFDHYKLKK